MWRVASTLFFEIIILDVPTIADRYMRYMVYSQPIYE